MRVLIVDDNKKLSSALEADLTAEGMTVDVVHEGFEGEDAAASGAYDAIVLDWMLPDIEGPMVCRSLRKRKINTPILMLTSMDQTEQIVEGFEAGADDYLTKPFDTAELVVRLRALTRRHTSDEPTKLELGPIHLDLLTRQFKLDGKTVDTTAREFSLIEFFLRRPNRVQSRHQIFENVWDVNYDENSNVLDVYISRIRKKLGAHSDYLRTVQGAGYMLTQPDTVDD
ncbi:MAG TPA: response regulator transcription factor [Phycisphaerae bacterium]|nr:response regulator transcription factor [Phycisphaerae bacterium]HRW51660.1 response regulator transcription factor [Phycisphaerae bacterium]